MLKKKDFFQDYEKNESTLNDNSRKIENYIYTGKMYIINKNPLNYRKIKAAYIFILLMIAFCYVSMATQNTPATHNIFVMLPYVFELLPVVYTILGLVKLVHVGTYLTSRDYYYTFRRLKKSVGGLKFLSILCNLGLICFWLQRGETRINQYELWFALGQLVLLIIGFVLSNLLRKYPAVEK